MKNLFVLTEEYSLYVHSVSGRNAHKHWDSPLIIYIFLTTEEIIFVSVFCCEKCGFRLGL
jgi:hypothetical protein